jgi:hypothetical protein
VSPIVQQVVVPGSAHVRITSVGSTAAAQVVRAAAGRTAVPLVSVPRGPVSVSSDSGTALVEAGNAFFPSTDSREGDAPATRNGPRSVPDPVAPPPSGSWESSLSGGLTGGPLLLLLGVLSTALLVVAVRRSRAQLDVFGCPQAFLAVLERPG